MEENRDQPAKKKRRRAYLDDFKKTGEGQYRYEGALYQSALPEKERKKAAGLLGLLCCSVTALTLAAGCVPSAGMQNSVYVLLPYAVQMAAALSTVWAYGRMARGGNPLREYIYESTVLKLPLRGGLTGCLALVCAAGEFIHLTLCRSEILSSVPFLAIQVITGAMGLLIPKIIHKLSYCRV